jgi:hypothetical protein
MAKGSRRHTYLSDQALVGSYEAKPERFGNREVHRIAGLRTISWAIFSSDSIAIVDIRL